MSNFEQKFTTSDNFGQRIPEVSFVFPIYLATLPNVVANFEKLDPNLNKKCCQISIKVHYAK